MDFCIDDLDITLGEIPLMQKGAPLDFDKTNASAYLKVSFGLGAGIGVWILGTMCESFNCEDRSSSWSVER